MGYGEHSDRVRAGAAEVADAWAWICERESGEKEALKVGSDAPRREQTPSGLRERQRR